MIPDLIRSSTAKDTQPSFPVIHKVGNVDIFVLPKFENYKR